MLNIWQIIFLALLQGVTELFPISSLGHTVILPSFLKWGDLVGDARFVPIIAALHLGTSIALVLYFWRDWLQVFRTVIKGATQVVQGKKTSRGTEEWVGWLIILGTIPAGLLGFVLEKRLKELFVSPLIASAFLVANGSILFLGEAMRRRAEGAVANLSPKEREARFRPLASLSWKEAIIVGLTQSLALIPGISRSGATMVAGLGVRLTHEDAARYSFLLGTPIIGAAALLEVPQLRGLPTNTLLLVGLGVALAGVAAFLSTKFLMKYFETGRLTPFAIYCWAAGLISLIVFIFVLRTGL